MAAARSPLKTDDVKYLKLMSIIEEIAMNNKTYLSLALAACMGAVSAPLWADVTPAPEHPANISTPAATPEEHTAAAALHKEHAAHHKGMVEHHKSVAAEYAKTGNQHLAKHHQELAKHHAALAEEHQKTAATHELAASPKK